MKNFKLLKKNINKNYERRYITEGVVGIGIIVNEG
jgi:hypothetical protein